MRSTATVLGAAVLTVGGIGGVVALTGTAPGDEASPVTRPVAPAKASVAPDVAEEMNGPQSEVRMATGIPMHAPGRTDRHRLAGNGQGNGCVVDYGKPGQCLPLQSPMQQAMPEMDHPWTCGEVRRLFPRGLEVTGRDSLGLDSDGDGVACGRGDA